MTLQAAVYVAPAIPCRVAKNPNAMWSPISCTLIWGDSQAVLIDTPITIAQTQDLANWIEEIIPGRQLSVVYITHGHADHFLGLPVLRKRYRNFKTVATAGTIEHMKAEISPKYFSNVWESFFPDQIDKNFELADPLPESSEFQVEGHSFQAIDVGHSDTYDSTILWVPDIRLAVCGDVVYGEMHQMLAIAKTPALQEEWIAAIEKIEALNPEMVVAGHKKPGEMDGTYHLEATKQYIRDFGKLTRKSKSSEELFNRMMEIYPHRGNPFALRMSTTAAFRRPPKL